MSSVRDLVTEALEELGVISQGETASDGDAESGLRRYNRLLDAWNADRRAVYADLFTTLGALTPNLNPHTIGATGTFVATRPVTIDGASIFLGTSPNVKVPLDMRDAEWWSEVRVPGVAATLPTDCFYDPTYPNGSIYLWPVPQTAYQIEIWTRAVLAQVTLNTDFALPPGYWRAHVLTLAEECAIPFKVPLDPKLVIEAARARMTAFGNNDRASRMTSDGATMPSAGGRSGGFNYLTGELTQR